MQIITLGIGPGTNDIEGLVLTGLGVLEVPPPIPSPSGDTGVTLGIAIDLAEGVTYTLPPKLVNVTVITLSGTIQVSLDQTNWITITLSSNKNFKTSAPFIRSVGGDSTIIAKGIKPWQPL